MKKYILALLGLLVLLVFGAFGKLVLKQSNYHKTIAAGTGMVLILEDFDKADLKVVTANTDKITINVDGNEQELDGLALEEDGLFAKFGFSGEWENISGTITVPEGMILDVRLSGDSSLTINDIEGESSVSGKDSFLVDTNNLDSLSVGSGGDIVLDGFGDLIVWDDDTWDIIDDEPTDEPVDIEDVYCGIGSQAIRNLCCETQNADSTPSCAGYGYWIFNNSLRECEHICDLDEDAEDPGPESDIDCSIGAQAERNQCCTDLKEGEYGGCVGQWYYDNSDKECAILCDDIPEEGQDEEENGGSASPGQQYDDPTSQYCSTITLSDDKNLCCNDALKNALSSGPRPGFPDCIGKWYFDDELGCEFECAEHTEMVEIINEIRQNLQSQQ